MKKNIIGQIDLTVGKVMPNLLIFVLPFFFTYLLNSFYSAIDLFYIGQFSDVYNVAAVSSGTTVMFAVNSIIMGLATGGSVIIGHYFGAKNEKGIEDSIRNFVIYMSLVAIGLTIIMLALSYPIMVWMQVEEGALQIAQQYVFILSSGIILYVGYISISAILRGLGNSFAGLIFVGAATITNIILDYVFVVMLNKGAIGAALATVIGEGVAFICAIIYLLIKRLPYKFKLKDWLQSKYLIPIIKTGLPVAIQDGLVVVSFGIVLAALSVRGALYTATVGVTDRVTSFGFVPLSALGCAISTSTAQNMGANRLDRVKEYVKCGLIISSIASLVIGGLLMLIPDKLASIFAANQTETIALATNYIRSTGLDIFVCGLIFPLNAVFIGSGHTFFAMGQNLGSTFLIRVPFALLTSLLFNSEMFVVGLCYPLSSLFSLMLCIIYYFSFKWVNTKLINKKEEICEE